MMQFAIAGFITSLLGTYLVRSFALKQKVLDVPDKTRKFQTNPVPLLGGTAIFLSFWTVVGYLVYFQPIFGVELIKAKLLAIFFGSVVLIAVGIADDVRGLSASVRLGITAFAIALTVFLGLDLNKITNPVGGYVYLSKIAGSILVFLWLLGMTYTTKITDGLDGLAIGIVAIGSLMLFFLSSSKSFFQPNVALLSLVFCFVCCGFLVFNFFPASIYLGESGSLFVGFMLGSLAVISGGKVATALLAMAIPAFDLLRVIIKRVKSGTSIFSGDRLHLHFRLVDIGLNPLLVSVLYYFFAGLFGFLALKLPSLGKLLALSLLFFVIITADKWLPEYKQGQPKTS